MFKNVEYAGFESHPELRALAEQLTPVLANEIGMWRENVRVKWSPHPDTDTGVLDLTLGLVLPNGVEGEFVGTFVPDDFTRDSWLARRCLWIWSDLLGILLEKQHQRVQEYLAEPVEA